MSIWAWLWIAWLAAFLCIEGAAVYRKGAQDTFSFHVWWWLGLRKVSAPPRFLWFRRMFLLCFGAWLCVHFATGGWI